MPCLTDYSEAKCAGMEMKRHSNPSSPYFLSNHQDLQGLVRSRHFFFLHIWFQSTAISQASLGMLRALTFLTFVPSFCVSLPIFLFVCLCTSFKHHRYPHTSYYCNCGCSLARGYSNKGPRENIILIDRKIQP